MASRNSVKFYIPNSFYHVYNRGVEKRNIFQDQQDFSVFLSYLSTYLTPKDELGLQQIISSENTNIQEKDKALKDLRLKNYATKMDLACYSLIPNHFHLLVRQSIPCLNYFMNSLGTRYGMYFNRKYKRSGVLFQDVYKAVLIESEEQLLHLSRYIHLNPLKYLGLPVSQWRNVTLPSSLPEYLNQRNSPWIKSSYVLDYFSKTNRNFSYESFLGLENDFEIIGESMIDYDEEEIMTS